jgi:vacuolar-type H+-ATPase subunit B/Vma2
MSRTLTIPDELYERLETEARARGLKGVESLLDSLARDENSLSERKEAVRKIDALREQLFAKYGEMPDSVELVREIREGDE